jgi:hypothetical protein
LSRFELGLLVVKTTGGMISLIQWIDSIDMMRNDLRFSMVFSLHHPVD